MNLKLIVWVCILLFSSCKLTSTEEFRTEILAKCVKIENGEATFKSANLNYSEIVVKDHLYKYKVGQQYILILRKN